MTRQEKQSIEDSLRKECQFLQSVASIFDDRESDELPAEAKEQNRIIYEGLLKIKAHLAEELNAIMTGEIDE